MSLKQLFLVLVILSSSLTFSQNTKLCGTDFVMQKYRDSNQFRAQQSQISINSH